MTVKIAGELRRRGPVKLWRPEVEPLRKHQDVRRAERHSGTTERQPDVLELIGWLRAELELRQDDLHRLHICFKIMLFMCLGLGRTARASDKSKRLRPRPDGDASANLKGESIDGQPYVQLRPRPRHARGIGHLGNFLGGSFDYDEDGPGGWWIVPEPGVELEPRRVTRSGRGGGALDLRRPGGRSN